MSANTATLQLHHREVFERNVTWALGGGTLAAVAHVLLHRAGVAAASLFGWGTPALFPSVDAVQFVPLSYLAIVATALSMIRGDKWDKLLLGALAVLVPAVPWLCGLAPSWSIGLSGASAGGLMVRSRLCDRGEEGQLGCDRPGWFNYGLGAVLTGVLAVAGTEVARALSFRLEDFSAPAFLTVVVAGLVVSLFVGLGSLAAHLALTPDPVEARCEELVPRLQGELKTLASRALSLYQQCGKSLAELPREPAREEMARTLSQMTREAVELAAEWNELELQLQHGARSDLATQVRELDLSVAAARDPIARKQLELAAASLREELGRLDELSLQRERIVAKLKAEVALLERARVVLIGMRSGQMQLKAAEFNALARKFNQLSSVQSAEARLADAMATNAELSHHELADADARIDGQDRPEGSTTTTRVPER